MFISSLDDVDRFIRWIGIGRRVPTAQSMNQIQFRPLARSAAVLPETIAQKDVQVLNRLGLHARPACNFVRCARQFQSRIELHVRGQTYSAQQVIDVLLAGLNLGTTFRIVARGSDAEFAVETLSLFLQHLKEIDAEEDAGLRSNPLQRFDLEDF